MRGTSLRVIAAFVLGIVIAPGVAAGATLDWQAPRGCPDAASLRARVERRLDRSLDDVAVTVAIQVSRSRGRYVARVDLGAFTMANDVRTLTSTRCGALADAVAVIIARVANDFAARAEVVFVSVVADAPVVIQAAAPGGRDVRHEDGLVDRVEPIVARGAASLRRWTINARASALSGIGVIPKVGLGAELAISVRAGNHLAELGAATWVASAAQFHDGAPAKVDVDLDVTVARYGWRPAALPLRAWLAVEVGSMHGGGVKLPTDQIESGRWVAAGTGFGIAWQMASWIRLVGGTEAMVAIERVKFSLGDGMVVYAPSPMSVRTTLGLELGWQ